MYLSIRALSCFIFNMLTFDQCFYLLRLLIAGLYWVYHQDDEFYNGLLAEVPDTSFRSAPNGRLLERIGEVEQTPGGGRLRLDPQGIPRGAIRDPVSFAGYTFNDVYYTGPTNAREWHGNRTCGCKVTASRKAHVGNKMMGKCPICSEYFDPSLL